jgi:hypothetical protein
MRVSIWNKQDGHMVNMKDFKSKNAGIKWAEKFISEFKTKENYWYTIA